MTEISLNRRIELIALRPDAGRTELEGLFKVARQYGCQAVCVTGSRVDLAVACLGDSPVKVAALVGLQAIEYRKLYPEEASAGA